MQATVLLFQVAPEKRTKLAVLCRKLKIRLQTAAVSQYDLTLIEILKGETGSAAKTLEHEMLLMAHLSPVQFRGFLDGFRTNRIAPVGLKAVLTETNAGWTAYELHDHIAEEHALRTAAQTGAFDTVLRGGTVIDGSGAAGVQADVGIVGGKIAAIGKLPDAGKVIDCSGKVVTPGFIDIHRHADAAVFREGFGRLELAQGLTTIVNGNCGLAIAPIAGENAAQVRKYLQPVTGAFDDSLPTATMQEYLDACAKQPLPISVGMLAGNGTIRTAVCGYEVLHPEDIHYINIHRLLEQALRDGALGVSLGLGYAPECFYTTDELIRALSPLSGTGIPITVHMREEGDGVVDALREMVTVCRALKTPVHISHLKAMGKRNWGIKIPEALSVLEQARQEGLVMSCDVYPYTAGSTQLMHILPPDFLAGGIDAIVARLLDPTEREKLTERIKTGRDFDNIAQLVGWENIVMSTLNLPENKPFEGMSVAEAAERRHQDPFSCCYDMLASERCAITMIDYITCEEDIARILRDPYSNLISDSTYPTQGRPHPRLHGTFVRAIEKYVLQDKVLPLEAMIRKLTMQPADVLGLGSKGRLAVGADADINVFDPAKLHEVGTYADPARPATGFDTILVGGRAAVEHGECTGICGGSVIRR